MTLMWLRGVLVLILLVMLMVLRHEDIPFGLKIQYKGVCFDGGFAWTQVTTSEPL
jgi:hypothetical protein